MSTTTNAERLREAAKVLHERAEAATAGPWEAELCEDDLFVGAGTALTVWTTHEGGIRTGRPATSYRSTDRIVEHALDGWGESGDSDEKQREADCDYIATVDPIFGRAVAVWLTAIAAELEHADWIRKTYTSHPDSGLRPAHLGEALAVVDAILGRAS